MHSQVPGHLLALAKRVTITQWHLHVLLLLAPHFQVMETSMPRRERSCDSLHHVPEWITRTTWSWTMPGTGVPESKSKVREFSSSSLNPSGVLLVSDYFQILRAYKGADWGVMAGSQPVGNCLAREWYRLSSSRWFSMNVGNQKENNL